MLRKLAFSDPQKKKKMDRKVFALNVRRDLHIYIAM